MHETETISANCALADEIADEIAFSKQRAMRYVAEAFAEAELDGVDEDCVVQVALFASFRHLVELYGEEPTAAFAEGLPSRVRNGAFTTTPKH